MKALGAIKWKLQRWSHAHIFTSKYSTRIIEMVRGKRGLEIGGPSTIFEKQVPVYPHIAALDNCVFSSSTIWEGERAEGETFVFSGRIGRNMITEGSELKPIPDLSCDFILASHCLEHMANPLKALRHWRRVLIPDGTLILVLPDKYRTFDYRRPITTLEHLRQDEQRGVGEDDMTHLEEFVNLWDYRRFPIAANPEEHRKRYSNNAQDRLMHHHVFDLELIQSMVECCGFFVLHQEALRPNHLLTVAKRVH